MFERRHNNLNFVLAEKLKLIFGRSILVIPPKFDFVNLTESFFLNENVNAFWLKAKSLYMEIKTASQLLPYKSIVNKYSLYGNIQFILFCNCPISRIVI